MYPKDEIQKTIEEWLRQAYKAAPGTYALEEFFNEYGDELLEGLQARKEYNESDYDDQCVIDKWNEIQNKLVPILYEAVISDLDFTRNYNDRMIADVIRGV